MSLPGGGYWYHPQEQPGEPDGRFVNAKMKKLEGLIHDICSTEDWSPNETDEMLVHLEPSAKSLRMDKRSADRLMKRGYDFARSTRRERGYGRMMKRSGFARVMKRGADGLMRIMKRGEDFLRIMKRGDEGDDEHDLQALKKDDETNVDHYRAALEDTDPDKYFIRAIKDGKYMVRMARSNSKNYLYRALRDPYHIRMARNVPGQEFYSRAA